MLKTISSPLVVDSPRPSPFKKESIKRFVQGITQHMWGKNTQESRSVDAASTSIDGKPIDTTKAQAAIDSILGGNTITLASDKQWEDLTDFFVAVGSIISDDDPQTEAKTRQTLGGPIDESATRFKKSIQYVTELATYAKKLIDAIYRGQSIQTLRNAFIQYPMGSNGACVPGEVIQIHLALAKLGSPVESYVMSVQETMLFDCVDLSGVSPSNKQHVRGAMTIVMGVSKQDMPDPHAYPRLKEVKYDDVIRFKDRVEKEVEERIRTDYETLKDIINKGSDTVSLEDQETLVNDNLLWQQIHHYNQEHEHDAGFEPIFLIEEDGDTYGEMKVVPHALDILKRFIESELGIVFNDEKLPPAPLTIATFIERGHEYLANATDDQLLDLLEDMWLKIEGLKGCNAKDRFTLIDALLKHRVAIERQILGTESSYTYRVQSLWKMISGPRAHSVDAQSGGSAGILDHPEVTFMVDVKNGTLPDNGVAYIRTRVYEKGGHGLLSFLAEYAPDRLEDLVSNAFLETLETSQSATLAECLFNDETVEREFTTLDAEAKEKIALHSVTAIVAKGRMDLFPTILTIVPKEQLINKLLEQNQNGNTALHVAGSKRMSECLEHLLTPEVINALGKEDIMRVLSVQNAEGQTPIHLATTTGMSTCVERLLTPDVINTLGKENVIQLLSVKNEEGQTPIHLAIARGMRTCIERLLSADVITALGKENIIHLLSDVDNKNCTPIHRAGASGEIEVFDRLLRPDVIQVLGPDCVKELLSVQDDYRETPLHVLAGNKGFQRPNNLLDPAVIDALGLENVKALLLIKNNKNNMFICHAAARGNKQYFDRLLESIDVLGVEFVKQILSNRNTFGEAFLGVAVYEGKGDFVVHMLRPEVIDKLSLDFIIELLSFQDVNGNTPLHMAVYHNLDPIFNTLLSETTLSHVGSIERLETLLFDIKNCGRQSVQQKVRASRMRYRLKGMARRIFALGYIFTSGRKAFLKKHVQRLKTSIESSYHQEGMVEEPDAPLVVNMTRSG